MSSNISVCRLCLAMDVRLFRISGTLQLVFEKISSTKLHTRDRRPVVACYLCYAHLNKCRKLMLMSARAENVLNAIAYSNSKITVKSVSQFDRDANGLCESLSCSRAEYFDSLALPSVDVKGEVKSDIESDNLEVSLQRPQTSILDSKMKINYEEVNVHDVKIEPIEEYDLSPYSNEIALTENIEFGKAKTSKNHKMKQAEKITITRKKPTDTHRCNFCQRKFKQKCHLTRHVKTHIDEKSYKCSICKRRFFRKDVLLRHEKNIHGEKLHKSNQTIEKRFKCNICQRRFSRKDNLSNHMKTHSGDRPFECDMCMRRFIHKSNLISHFRTHPVDTPYECYICCQRFILKDLMQNHIKMHWM